MALALWPVSVLIAGTVTNSDPAAVAEAIEAGGTIRLAFDGTVKLTNTLAIAKDTTIDATGHAVTFDGDNKVRHFTVQKGARLQLLGLSLINGRHAGAEGQTYEDGEVGHGGSICNQGGWLELTGCQFINNSSRGGDGGPPDPSGDIFSPNTSTSGAPAYGGAIYSSGGRLRVEGCVFTGNSCAGGTGRTSTFSGVRGESAWGGAIYSSNTVAALIGGVFRSNIVQAGRTVSSGGGSAGGGALADVDGEAFISSGVFADNQVIGTTRAEYLSSETGSANGGAVYHGSGMMRVEGTLFERNTVLGGDGFNRGLNFRFSARGNGGALFNGTGQLDLRTSTLALNQALGGNGEGDRVPGVGGAGSGGGIFNLGQLTVVNCTLAQNLAQGGSEISQGFNGVSGGSAYGGAIFSESGEVLLLHATLAENMVAIGEGRGGQPEALGSSLRVTEGAVTLISAVLSCANAQTNVSGAIIDGGHNLSSDASARFTSESSRANLDPLLGPLAGNGGPTPTMALLPGSPAIDAGDDAAAPPGDQRGLGRPVGAHSDIGAFEVGLSGTPRITAGPRDATVGAGQTVSFSVYVDALPVSYQWQRDDADLPGATHAVLTLEKAELSQAGQYRAIVSNPSGSVTSSPATLTVLPPTPPEILAQPEGWAVPAGQPLVLSVTATNLLPLRYQWQREGTGIPGARDPLLVFAAVSPDDAGTYTVVVSTEFMSTNSAPAVVTVLSAEFPSILEEPDDLAVKQGQNAAFTVVARGGAPLEFQWFFEGLELPGATNSTLSLESVRLTRSGNYRVRIRNSFGEVMSPPAMLSVEPTTVDPWFVSAVAGPRALGVQKDGKAVTVAWFGRHGVFRLNADGSVDSSFAFSPAKEATTLDIRACLFGSDDSMIVRYSHDSTHYFLRRFNRDGNLDPSFEAVLPQGGLGLFVLQPDGKVVAANSGRRTIIRYNFDGTLDSAFAPQVTEPGSLGRLIVQPDGQLLVGIVGTNYNPAEQLVRFDAAGVRDPQYNVTFHWVNAVASQRDGKLLAGGFFNSVNGVAATNLVRIHDDGSVDASFHPPSLAGEVSSIAMDDAGNIYAGGRFPGGLVRLAPDGTLDPTFHPEVEGGGVWFIVPVGEDRVLIGGAFTHVDGVPRPGLARLFVSSPVPRITELLRLGSTVRLSVRAEEGSRCVVECADSLRAGSWTALESITGNGSAQVVAHTNVAAAQLFYRVRVE